MAFKPKLVKADAETPEVDADLLKLAHQFLADVAAGNVQGALVFTEGADALDWGSAGQYEPYAMRTYALRRLDDLLDMAEMDAEGEA